MRTLLGTLLGIKPPTRLRWASRTRGQKTSLTGLELLIFLSSVKRLIHSAKRAGDVGGLRFCHPGYDFYYPNDLAAALRYLSEGRARWWARPPWHEPRQQQRIAPPPLPRPPNRGEGHQAYQPREVPHPPCPASRAWSTNNSALLRLWWSVFAELPVAVVKRTKSFSGLCDEIWGAQCA